MPNVDIPNYLQKDDLHRPSKGFVKLVEDLEAEMEDFSPRPFQIQPLLVDPSSPSTGQIWLIVTSDEDSNVIIIENRTSDPTTPVLGQIWLRTDL